MPGTARAGRAAPSTWRVVERPALRARRAGGSLAWPVAAYAEHMADDLPLLLPTGGAHAALAPLAARAVELAAHAVSPHTRRAYQRGWRSFETWAQAHGLVALPATPETLTLYLTDRATAVRVATLEQELAAIAAAHRAADRVSPTEDRTVRLVWKGIRRTYGAPARQKAPVNVVDLIRMVDALDPGTGGIRDRALLLLGFAGALRRSELVALDVEDLTPSSDGYALLVRRSKSDAVGDGHRIGIPNGRRPETCPVRALRAWIDHAAVQTGPLFRPVDRHGRIQPTRLGARAVAEVVKRAAQRVGLDPAGVSGHSLRAGLATEAVRAGLSERAIMAQTRHISVVTFRGYVRTGSLFLDNPAAALL